MTTQAITQEKLGFGKTIASLSRPFWFANTIELFERWAYYGLRGGFLSVYMVTVVASGGLGLNHIQKGSIYASWALIQCFFPMFSGGYSDRYGLKKTIVVAVLLTAVGYVLMGTQTTYHGFFAACMLVALGTAIFKPGLQGIVAHSTTQQTGPLGWSIFYMIVNIGGFIGPLITGFMRVLPWKYIFFLCAGIHLLNLLLLFGFKEPHSGGSKKQIDPNIFKEFGKIFWNSIRNLFEPRLIAFLLIFSGFWLMFQQLFDLLPNFITDWVDSSMIYGFLGSTFGSQALLHKAATGVNLPAEWMLNIDALSIVILMLPIGWFFGRFKAVPAMVLGILVATIGIIFAGHSMNGWYCILGIFIFAIGEMIASPRKNEYLSLISPPEKKALYMGYLNFPIAIGWSIGSKIGGYFYQNYGDKLTLTRRCLEDFVHMSKDAVAAIPPENLLTELTTKLNLASTHETTQFLFKTYRPDKVWWIFGAIGLVAMIGMLIYNLAVERHRTGTLSGIK